MLKLVIGELYGMNSIEQLMSTIQDMRNIGMTDNEIQEVLDRSKTVKKDIQEMLDRGKEDENGSV